MYIYCEGGNDLIFNLQIKKTQTKYNLMKVTKSMFTMKNWNYFHKGLLSLNNREKKKRKK